MTTEELNNGLIDNFIIEKSHHKNNMPTFIFTPKTDIGQLCVDDMLNPPMFISLEGSPRLFNSNIFPTYNILKKFYGLNLPLLALRRIWLNFLLERYGNR
jgi:hypothetical protein